MGTIPYLFMIAVGLAAGLSSICIWSQRSLYTKSLAVFCTALFIPVGYAGLSDLLSRPKPVALEWWLDKADEATVLGSQMQEGQGLYLWLQVAGEPEPRAYRMPWDQKAAQELQAALEEAQRNGTQARMRLPFERSLDQREPKFYAPPQLAMPPKDLAQPPAQIYQQPGQNA